MNSSFVWACAIEPGPMQTAGQSARLRTEASENQGAVVKPRAASPSRFTHGSDSSVSSGGGVALHPHVDVGHGFAQRGLDLRAQMLPARRPARRGQSISIRHWSGTMLILLPPEIVPTFSVAAPSFAMRLGAPDRE